MTRRADHSAKPRAILLVVGVASIGLIVLFFGDRHDQPAVARPPSPTTQYKPAEAVKPAAGAIVLTSRYAPAMPRPEVADDGIKIMGPGNSDSTTHGPRHPHPITPRHARIFQENAMLGALNSAMDVGDADTLLQLNQQYKSEYPDDPQQLQAGYDLIADCLGQRTDATRAMAERYFSEERGSTLRRYVKRHCLE